MINKRVFLVFDFPFISNLLLFFFKRVFAGYCNLKK